MSYELKDLWPLIQQDIAGAIAAHPLLGSRHVVTVEDGDVENILDKKVTSAIGLGPDGKAGGGWLVLPIEEASDDNVSLPGGPLKLKITIQFVENVTVNRGGRGTKIPCRVWIAIAEKVLKLYTAVGLTQNLIPVEPVIHGFTPDKDSTLRVGQLEFHATEADFKPYQKLGRPQIAVANAQATQPGNYLLAGAAQVTVTAADANTATIYYTTDGSHPWSGNAQAQVYNGPVAVNAPLLFRARAFPAAGANYEASDTAAVNFYQ